MDDSDEDNRESVSKRLRSPPEAASNHADNSDPDLLNTRSDEEVESPPPRRVAPRRSVQRRPKFTRRKIQGYDLKIPEERGQAGQLLRVKLIHFMCHEHFEIYFGKHVNFISGRNGSGKSAILQAIQVCFGSKAYDTGRGSQLKGFIKTGRSYAKAMVSMWNTGPDAYRREEFGRVITIERFFAPSGNRYVLISEDGCRVSERKRDLEELMTAFGILIKNPMVVLTQGAAGSFLRGKKLVSDLYGLYMKATEFEEAAEEHKESHAQIQNQKQHIDAIRIQLRELNEHRDDLAERLERAEEEREAVECLEHAKNAFGHLQVKEKLAQVDEKEELRQQTETALESLREQLEEKKMELDKSTEERDAFDAASHAAGIRKMLDQLRVEENELKDQKRAAERACKEPRKRIQNLQAEIRQLESSKENKKSHLESLKNDDGEEVKAAREEFDREVQERECVVERLRSDLEAATEANTKLAEAMENQEKRLKRMVDACDDHKADVRRLHEHLSQLRRTQRDPITMFGGADIKNLLQAIQHNKRQFHKEPIGPLGRYLNVRDEMWSVPIEFSIGNLFNAFIVHSFHDEEILRALCRKIHPRMGFQIVVYPFERAPYQIGGYENPPHLTILRMLNIAQFEYTDVIKNVLIDYGSVERIVLCPSEQEALQILREATTAFMPHSVRLPTGRKVYTRGNAEVSMHDGRKLQPRLVKDISQLISRTQLEIEHQNTTFATKEREKGDCEKIYQSLRQDAEEADLQRRSVHQQHQRALQELNALKECGPRLPPYAAFDIETLEDDIQIVVQKIEATHEQVRNVEEELAFKEEQVRSTEDRITAHKQEFQSRKAHADQLSEEMNGIIARSRAASQAFDKAQESVNQKESQLNTLAEALEGLVGEMKELREKAVSQCTAGQARVSTTYLQARLPAIEHETEPLTAARLDIWMTELNRKIRNFHLHSNDDYEELRVEHDHVKERIAQQGEAIETLQQICIESEIGFKKRGEIYRQNQKRMDARINSHFTRYMKKRGHHGGLKANHKDQTVDIRVKMAGQDDTVRDMASLSGGERSFTTVSLLLALASVVNSPFHCMDEFDVFTDAITKRCAIQALLETAAMEKTHSQFIFFSPQEVGTVEDVRQAINDQHESSSEAPLIPSNFVTIYHLFPPERTPAADQTAREED